MGIIEQLEDTKLRTLPFFDLSEAELNKNRGAGSWSIRWILHHLADTETVLYERIRRTIAEPTRQVIWAFDQDAWTRGLNYDTLPLTVSKGIYSAVRDGIIHQAKAHYEVNGSRQYVHSEVGIRTLKEEFDKVAWHNERHLQQIASALSQQ